MPNKENEDQHISIESLHLWHQAILAKYSSLDTANTSLESKTGVIFAASVALITFLANNLVTDGQFNMLQGMGTAGMMLAAVLCLLALRVRTGATPTHTTQEMPTYYKKTDEEFVWHQIADLEDAVTRESQVNERKAQLYSWILYTFGISGLLLALSQFFGITITI